MISSTRLNNSTGGTYDSATHTVTATPGAAQVVITLAN